MDKHEIPILEYLYEAWQDKGLFSADVGGWTKTYRIEDDLKIPRDDLSRCLRLLHSEGLIDAESTDFDTAQPLIKISSPKGIEHLKDLKSKFIDAWHFRKRNKESESLARNWDESGSVNPHMRLEIVTGDDAYKEGIVYVKSNFMYSMWDVLSPEMAKEYDFYSYYLDHSKDEEKGFLWLSGSGFWRITNFEKRDDEVRVFLRR